MKLAFVGGLILFVVMTMSMAQIRYALSNPISSISTIIALTLEIGLIIYVSYRYLSGGKPTSFNTYGLVGSKGGKATKRKSNLDYNRKN